MRLRLPHRMRDDRGQALVEIALVLPLLVLVILTTVDFGKAYNFWLDETHLANAAARWAAVNQLPYASVPACATQTIDCQLQKNEAEGELRNGSASVTPVQISFCLPGASGSEGNVGQPVRAKVTTTYTWLGFLTGGKWAIPGLSLSKSITATATMRLEQPYSLTDSTKNNYTATLGSC